MSKEHEHKKITGVDESTLQGDEKVHVERDGVRAERNCEHNSSNDHSTQPSSGGNGTIGPDIPYRHPVDIDMAIPFSHVSSVESPRKITPAEGDKKVVNIETEPPKD